MALIILWIRIYDSVWGSHKDASNWYDFECTDICVLICQDQNILRTSLEVWRAITDQRASAAQNEYVQRSFTTSKIFVQTNQYRDLFYALAHAIDQSRVFNSITCQPEILRSRTIHIGLYSLGHVKHIPVYHQRPHPFFVPHGFFYFLFFKIIFPADRVRNPREIFTDDRPFWKHQFILTTDTHM
jgi:hypothetical protein